MYFAQIDYFILPSIFVILETGSCIVLATASKIQPKISLLDSHFPSFFSFGIEIPSGKILSIPYSNTRIVYCSYFNIVTYITAIKSSMYTSKIFNRVSVSSSQAFNGGISSGIIMGLR